MHPSELRHFGVKGMHWGLRRFQNEDGTYTMLGKLRRRKKNQSEDYVRSREIGKKKYYQMTTKELKEYNQRMQQEQQYFKIRETPFRDAMATAASVGAVATGMNSLYKTYKNIRKSVKK